MTLLNILGQAAFVVAFLGIITFLIRAELSYNGKITL